MDAIWKAILFSLFQFTQWVDAVIFVFSLENEVSFQSVYTFYAKMAHFRNTAEIPLILVGTQGKNSFHNVPFLDIPVWKNRKSYCIHHGSALLSNVNPFYPEWTHLLYILEVSIFN